MFYQYSTMDSNREPLKTILSPSISPTTQALTPWKAHSHSEVMTLNTKMETSNIIMSHCRNGGQLMSIRFLVKDNHGLSILV